MLTTIREKTQGIIATFVLALIGIPFALWGVNSYLDAGVRSDVASVNGEKISEMDYRTAFDGFRRQLDPRMADSPEVKRMVVESLIERELLERDAHDQGYRLGNERLAKMIRELPYFQTNGRFDSRLYEDLLRRQGTSVREFESLRRAEALTMQIQTGLVDSGIVTLGEVDNLVRLLKQERDLAYTAIASDRFLKTVKVAPEQVQQYYDSNPDMFRTQEQVRVEYVRLSAQDVAKNHKPSDAELRQLYAEDGSKITRAETRRVSHVLITLAPGADADDAKRAQVKIEDIEKQARAGVDFSQLARMHSQDDSTASKGGDLGDLQPGLLPKSLEEAVSVLKQGEITKPIRSEFGYHVAKLTALKPAVQKSFEEMRAQLAKQATQRYTEERFYEASEKLRNVVYDQPDSLAPAAEALGLKVEASDWFGRNGGMGVTAHPRVIEASFSNEVLQQKRNSDAIELSGDTLMAVRVVGHRPAEPKPFNDVRTQIERSLLEGAAHKATQELGENIIKELATGQSLEAIARKHGLPVQGPKTVTRDLAQGFDRAVVDAAFRAPRPEAGKTAFGGVELIARGYAVYAVTRVRDGDPAKADAASKDRAKRMLTAQRSQGYYADYRAGLKKKADIKIYQDRL
ncbi:MAG TPA: SurA N-terminal domain-containing protein [Burkholderiales bacterium]|nr:SurA N-terminal domain-containing protein [Burkholderiales bacterium]